MQASTVSKTRPKFMKGFFMPCWNTDSFGLADDEIGPLDNNDGDEEGGVAGELKLLPVSVGPFLPVRIFQVVHSLRVPFSPQTEQGARPEAIFTHYHKVYEESCSPC